MAASLPNGTRLALATAYEAPIPITAISNAAEAVATAGNTLATGDFVELTSGWPQINGGVFRVKSATATTVTIEGLDSSDLEMFPAGEGVGSLRKIDGWSPISEVLELTTNGGEPKQATYQFLESENEAQIPDGFSAQSLQFSTTDDSTLPGYKTLKSASAKGAVRALRLRLKSGGIILFNGYPAFNETPTMTKGQVMACKATFSLLGKPNRY